MRVYGQRQNRGSIAPTFPSNIIITNLLIKRTIHFTFTSRRANPAPAPRGAAPVRTEQRAGGRRRVQ